MFVNFVARNEITNTDNYPHLNQENSFPQIP